MKKFYFSGNEKNICIINIKTFLGESPIWVNSLKSFFWVDVYKGNINSFDIIAKKINKIKLRESVSFIKYFKNNFFFIGLKNKICILNIRNKKIKIIYTFKDLLKSQRINDAFLYQNQDLFFSVYDEKKKIMGSLYCLDKCNSLRLIDKNYITPNGPAFSRCKKYMFHNDTSKRIIYIFKKNKYNEFKKKEIFIKFKKKYGKPDGIIVDQFNNLWVGMFGGSSVINIKIKNRKIIQQIFLPSLNITNCTIGGRNKDLLFVTSAMKKIKKEELKKNIFYGNSFIIKLISKSNHLSL